MFTDEIVQEIIDYLKQAELLKQEEKYKRILYLASPEYRVHSIKEEISKIIQWKPNTKNHLDINTIVPFGKHKGSYYGSIINVDFEYAKWLADIYTRPLSYRTDLIIREIDKLLIIYKEIPYLNDFQKYITF